MRLQKFHSHSCHKSTKNVNSIRKKKLYIFPLCTQKIHFRLAILNENN